MRLRPPARAGGHAHASQFFILLSGLSKSAQLEMICVIDKKENRAIKENQKIRDLSMHFHIAEMRNGQSAMAVWGLIVPACFDVTRNVPEHVTTGLANVTLHPRSGGLFHQTIRVPQFRDFA
ncbi:hypothetical protein LGN22_13680 [Burkholderia cenocepacia]|uniref:Uncharacterized protein n=1 Tax=Burkholderia cenocepacia TaxID=95486 RepID=A0AAW4TBN4_9BURK|nr:hypothetical protein [Burkholderia cenocepacia]MCA8379921.1 hypothetical protein [Burkholderia cenocepacia]